MGLLTISGAVMGFGWERRGEQLERAVRGKEEERKKKAEEKEEGLT